MARTGRQHRVVIIGSGFGGLFAAKALRRQPVDVTLIGRTTHHLFQPLLYQVATGILSEGEIAPVTREVLRRQRNVTVVLGLVERVDLAARVVHWRLHEERGTTAYDSLVVAAGAGQSYFGKDQFATFAPGLKTIDDALELRARIFWAFERAEVEPDPAERERLLTFAVVGAGPTGVEMAGQIRELATHTLRRDFRRIDPGKARVVLLDAADQVLGAFGERLGRKTRRSLEELGVEVLLGAMVTDLDAAGLAVRHPDGSTQRIEAATKVWAAGVQANPLGPALAQQAGAATDRSGRVVVARDLSLPGHPEVFVIGDLMAVPGVPGVAQGAIQSGRYVARLVATRAAAPGPARDRALAVAQRPFTYKDKGSMATIAKFSAVARIGRLEFTGFLAWVSWLFLHLLYIAGFKQRLSTLLRWAISFLSNARSERVTTNQQLVGRLALEELGQHSSGPLVAGQDVVPDTDRQPRMEQ